MIQSDVVTIGVTGGTGVLGRRLVTTLLVHGFNVCCLVRSHNKAAELRRRGVECIVGDLHEKAALASLAKKSDSIVHLAALVGYATPSEYHHANVDGTSNVCEAILANNPQCRLIHCSSIAVLRRYRRMKCFNTPYAKSKFEADQRVKQYMREGLGAGIFYPGLIYGPEDTNLVPTLMKYLKQKKLFLLTGGEHHAPLVYIDDLCDLILHMINAGAECKAQYLGVGKGEVGIHEFINVLADKTNSEPPSLKFPKHLVMPFAVLAEWSYRLIGKRSFPSLSRRAVDLLSINMGGQMSMLEQQDWAPKTSVSTGLNEALQWLDNRDKQ